MNAVLVAHCFGLQLAEADNLEVVSQNNLKQPLKGVELTCASFFKGSSLAEVTGIR